MDYKKANATHPRMGLNNELCDNPKYWCRLHEVWLSENDVKKKRCKERPTMDLISTYVCGNLESRSYKDFVNNMKQ